LRTIYVAQDGWETASSAVRRSTAAENSRIEQVVRTITAHVREHGDDALLELGRRFDCPTMERLLVTPEEWDEACDQVDSDTKRVIAAAAANIIAFHEKQKRTSWMDAQTGVVTGQVIRPLQRVGLYIPGGLAVYPSSVLMCGLPAQVAGVPELVMCSPCGKDGRLHPLVLYAARVVGIQQVFKVGGAGAIAAMAFGTATVRAVDKIAGPGNAYVTQAKKQLWGVVDIDMLAGPSEVCVVADEGANPAFAAADMLTQAEHESDTAAYLITPSSTIARAVAEELERQMALLPRREILAESLARHGAIVVTETLSQAFDLANVCAPEHLALMVRDPFAALGAIRNAGAILMGDYAPQTLGDYLAGPSHTLPTSGTARFASPLHVDTFLKKSSFIYYTSDALAQVAPTLEQFATIEGFEAHAAAVRARKAN
jgi:histidinol dehydrogenase